MNLARYQSVPGIFQCCGAWLAPEHAVLAHRLALCDRNETVTVFAVLCALQEVLYDLPNQPMMWVGQILLMRFEMRKWSLPMFQQSCLRSHSLA